MKINNINVLGILFVLIMFVFSACVKELKPLPQADFTYTTSAECTLPLSVSFENLSQNAEVYRWDFGDGTPIVHNESPIHVYASEGIYNATLTAYGPGGTHETMLVIYVVTNPIVTFYTYDNNVEVGDSVYFFSTTNSTLPSTWLWSFGDGFTSTLENPVHVYSYPGAYTVVLTATNACGATYEVQNNYVVVSNSSLPPIPDFYADQTLINTGSTVNFTDLTQNNPDNWEWTFFGGTPLSSFLQNPTGIVYNTPGTFDVQLKAASPIGIDSIIKYAYITVVQPGLAPVANFTANATNITAGSSINFTDLSLNSPTSWSWQFQGGTPATSTLQNPNNITYNTPGSYHVSLTATNAQGSDIETKQYYINVSPLVVTQVQIKKIILENMPFPTVPPFFRNPYYRITDISNNILRDGRAEYIANVVGKTLPVSWALNPYFVVPQIAGQYKIRIFDWKSNPANDIYVGEVVFNMSNYVNPPNAYPATITLMQNQLKITLELQWQ